jgi:hypothetical protein
MTLNAGKAKEVKRTMCWENYRTWIVGIIIASVIMYGFSGQCDMGNLYMQTSTIASIFSHDCACACACVFCLCVFKIMYGVFSYVALAAYCGKMDVTQC